jgi:glycosyltransferase involved in cell wall biosynthesis
LAAALTAVAFVLVVVPLGRRRARRMRRGDLRPRILWGPVPLISIRYWAEAGRRYGYVSDTLVYRVYDINARSDFDHVLDRYASLPVVGRLVPYLALLWASLRYDTFCFFFDGGLLWETPFWRQELPLLRLAGKKIVVSPYGGDARLPSATRRLDRWHVYIDVPIGAEDRDESDVLRRRAAFARWADVMLGYNDLVEDLPRLEGVLPFALDLDRWTPVSVPDDDVVTIVHSSNHRHYKGTRFIEQAVAELQDEGLSVELVVVEGVSNEEAKRMYERADLIAGDLLIGGYSYFGVEAMALGKPVIAYLRPSAEPQHPEWAECPVVRATPETVKDEMRQLVLDPERRRRLGELGPPYVREYHSYEAVGALLDEIYRRLWTPHVPVRHGETATTGSGRGS